jgi:hypothetical protein
MTTKKNIEQTDDDLTDEQWERIQHSMEQAKNGQTITLEELYEKMRSWKENRLSLSSKRKY